MLRHLLVNKELFMISSQLRKYTCNKYFALKEQFLCCLGRLQMSYPKYFVRPRSGIGDENLKIRGYNLNRMFFCCGESQIQEVYRVRNKKIRNSQIATFDQIDQKTARSFLPHMQVFKVKQSDYNALVQQYKTSKELWQDVSFPPTSASLGDIPQIKDNSWKRLSQIVTDPVLFDGRIEPQDIIQGALGDCYFLSAVAALAERQSRITQIFGQQPGSSNAIYRVTLRINGTIQEIIIDDYVPVNMKGEPIFCQPNKNQIWVPLFQKAWAKANGSYANIIGSPTQIFKAATYAPSQVYETSPNKEQNEALWRIIRQNARKNRPCCCGTNEDEKVEWAQLGLVPGHAYTLIDAAQLQDMKGNIVRVLKLRNPWGNTEWRGQACQRDSFFWSQIAPTQERTLFLKDWTIKNDGIFFILFKDYCKYFGQTHICFMEEDGNYVFENYQPLKKNGSFWECQIFEEDDYFFELHQQNTRAKNQEELSISRATILLAKRVGSKYQYIAGIMSHYEEDTTLKVHLQAGTYIIFTKFDPSIVLKTFPASASVSVYSLHYAVLGSMDKTKCDNILRESFLAFAMEHKRKKYEDNTLWISYKLMFKEGGYAFIAFGSEADSKHKWEVTFNQSDFEKNGFKLKKPFKQKGENQSFQVLPGHSEIILVRIKNQNLKNLKFPPAISWKVVEIS